jgi:hypothetical protein
MPDVKNVKIDFAQLKNTIESGKKAQHEKQVALGNVPEGAIMKSNKRSFLNELVTSMHSGVKTSAVEAITAVNETVEYKKGVPQAVAKNKNSYAPPRRRNQVNEQTIPQQQVRRTGASDWGMSGNGNVNLNPQGGGYGDDRDMAFEENLSKVNAEFDQRMMNNNPMVAQNPRMQQMVQQYGGQYPQQTQQQYVVEAQPQAMNEQMEHMEKNMEKIVESNLKSVLTNIYTKQKIQESLVELLQSDDGLKILARAINEIAKRNKANQQKK